MVYIRVRNRRKKLGAVFAGAVSQKKSRCGVRRCGITKKNLGAVFAGAVLQKKRFRTLGQTAEFTVGHTLVTEVGFEPWRCKWSSASLIIVRSTTKDRAEQIKVL